MAKKDKAARLPKKVAGVKLPKQFRKSAGVVAELAQNPIAREVVSAALVAGATALAKRKVKDAAGVSNARKPAGELDALIAQGKDVGNMFAQGVTAFLGALLKPTEKAEEVADAPVAGKPAAVKRAATPTAAKPATVRTGTRKAAPAKPTATRSPTRAKPGPKPTVR